MEKQKVEKIYRYENASGETVVEVVRYTPKSFAVRQPNKDGSWSWNAKGAEDVPYRLPKLLKAKPEKWVFVTEGEKDADSLAKIGKLATTNRGGAGKWKDGYARYFKDRYVVVLPHNDQPGKNHALDVAAKLIGVARWVKVVALPNLPEGGDVSDWIAAGHSEEELHELVRSTPRYVDGENEQPVTVRAGLPFLRATEVRKRHRRAVSWVAKPWFAQGAITAIVGKVKEAGKTTWTTHAAASVLRGDDFMGVPTTQSEVVYLTEQPIATFAAALERAGIDNCNALNLLYLSDVLAEQWAKLVEGAVERCISTGAKLLIVDTLPAFSNSEGSENDATAALAAMRPLSLATAKDLSVGVVLHSRKSGGGVSDSARGSSAFIGAADIVLNINKPQGNRPRVRIIEGISRLDELPSRTFIELTDEGYVSHGDHLALAVDEAKSSIAELLKNSGIALTVEEICGNGIERTTAQKALAGMIKTGSVRRGGRGKRGSPYVYSTRNAENKS
jgi:putative DNA primase/helicase